MIAEIADDDPSVSARVARDPQGEFVGFGAPTTPVMKPADVARGQAAIKVVKQLGLPRTWSPEWCLG